MRFSLLLLLIIGTATAPCAYATTPAPILLLLLGTEEDGGPTEIKNLLSALRNEIVKKISGGTRQAVESYVSAYPLQAPDESDPIAVKASEGEIPELIVAVGRRDWAYASAGVEYTFLGVFGEGQESLLDTALWCFLEAALLRMDESEHLINVAFHLNERGEYAKAQRILEFALPLDPTSPGLNNNLAYALSKQGKFLPAISKAVTALKGGQGVSFILERLGHYLQSAGLNDASNLVLQPESPDTTKWREVDMSMLSGLGKSVYVDLLDIDEEFWLDVFDIPLDPELNNTIEELRGLKISHAHGHIYGACCNAVWDACSWGVVCGVAGCCGCKINGVLTSYQITTQIQALLKRNHRRRFIDIPLSMLAPRLDQGLDLIDKAELSDTDQGILLNFWYGWYASQFHYFANQWSGPESFSFSDYITKEIHTCPPSGMMNQGTMCIYSGDVEKYWDCVQGLSEEKARKLADSIKQLENDPFYSYVRCAVAFCGPFRLQLSTPFISFNINSRTQEFEITVGAGLQFTGGWNLKKNEPIIGIGYSVNLGQFIKAGAVVKYKPTTGLVGSVDLGSTLPTPMPDGYYEPSVAKLFQGLN